MTGYDIAKNERPVTVAKRRPQYRPLKEFRSPLRERELSEQEKHQQNFLGLIKSRGALRIKDRPARFTELELNRFIEAELPGITLWRLPIESELIFLDLWDGCLLAAPVRKSGVRAGDFAKMVRGDRCVFGRVSAVHPVGDGLLVGLEMLTLTADQVVPL